MTTTKLAPTIQVHSAQRRVTKTAHSRQQSEEKKTRSNPGRSVNFSQPELRNQDQRNPWVQLQYISQMHFADPTLPGKLVAEALQMHWWDVSAV